MIFKDFQLFQAAGTLRTAASTPPTVPATQEIIFLDIKTILADDLGCGGVFRVVLRPSARVKIKEIPKVLHYKENQ